MAWCMLNVKQWVWQSKHLITSNVKVQLAIQVITVSWHKPRSGIAGPRIAILLALRILHDLLHSGCFQLPSQMWAGRVPLAPWSPQRVFLQTGWWCLPSLVASHSSLLHWFASLREGETVMEGSHGRKSISFHVIFLFSFKKNVRKLHMMKLD